MPPWRAAAGRPILSVESNSAGQNSTRSACQLAPLRQVVIEEPHALSIPKGFRQAEYAPADALEDC
jgi:hypothetical protein